MAINLTALKTEILSDPTTRGYPPWTDDATAADVAQQIAELLNEQRQISGYVRRSIPAAEVRGTYVPAELGQLTATELQVLTLYTGGDGTIDGADDNVVTVLRNVFPPNSTTRTNLTALRETGSRAWELFGEGSQVTWQNVVAALRS